MFFDFINEKPDIHYFLYEIVHHCNLNCNYCDHCSPIAKPEYVSVEQFESDIKQVKKTFKKINSIGIMGGEPLLHNELVKILIQTKHIIEDTQIRLFTNGILLKDQNDKFWQTVKETKTLLFVTKYGNTFNYADIEEKIKKYNILLEYMDNTNVKEKIFHKIAFNVNGLENQKIAHNNCYHSTHCHQLENGILYKCTIVPASRHFNDYFNLNLQISDKDGIDLYKKHSKKEIEEYFKKPIPFCRYCNMEERCKVFNWEISNKNIEEWT